jgi:cob(I)alamin adenosyltransferase
LKINLIKQIRLYNLKNKIKPMSIYTGGGDKGNTSLLSGQRINKDNSRVEAYGTIDELGAQLGVCRALCIQQNGSDMSEIILDMQRDLFRVGMQLSSEQVYWNRLEHLIAPSDIEKLEETIDRLESIYGLPAFFVSPGETIIGATLHVARTICRRAERRIITAVAGENGYEPILTYINRLSDLLFALSWTLENRELIAKELKRS